MIRVGVAVFALAGFAYLGAGCSIPDCETAVDRLACIAEEFGSATVSMPILSRPDNRFAFDLNRTALDYFKDAKTEVQGGAAFFEQIVNSLSAGASVQLDPTQAAAYSEALRQFFSDRGRIQERQRLRDDAADLELRAAQIEHDVARRSFQRALEAAAREPDESDREAMVAAAKTKFAAATKAFAAARQRHADSRAPENTDPKYPTAATDGTNTPSVPSGVARGPDGARKVLSEDRFAKFGGLLGALNPTVNNRSAIITSAGDKAVEAIFSILGKPEDAQKFKHKAVVFGVAMVSVNPGWRTRTGFAADISMNVELGLQPARPATVKRYTRDREIPGALRRRVGLDAGIPVDELPSAVRDLANADRVHPSYGGTKLARYVAEEKPLTIPILVAAVSPMTDVQTLDLRASFRRRTELALALSFALRSAGLGAQAEAFQQYVKDQQKDVSTRTPDVATSSYAIGNMIGYQVGPTLRALDSPAAPNPEPGYSLSRQSFPVLFILGVDRANARPQVIPCQKDGSFDLFEPRVHFTQTTRWLPLSEKAACHRLSESRILGLSAKLNRAPPEVDIDGKLTSVTGLPPKTQALLKIRYDKLRALVFGYSAFTPLPLDAIFTGKPPPTVNALVPNKISLACKDGKPQSAQKIVTLLGTGLDRIDLDRVTLAAGDADRLSATRVGDAIQIKMDVKTAKEPLLFQLPRLDEETFVYPAPIVVSVKQEPTVVHRAHPDKLEWTPKAGGATTKDFDIILTGENLRRVKVDTVTVFSGDKLAVVVGAAKYDGGAVKVKLTAKESGIVVLKMSLTGSSSKLQTILSPPLVLSRKTPPKKKPAAATTVTLETTTTPGKATQKVTVTGGADTNSVEAARDVIRAEVEKSKAPPAPTPNARGNGKNND